MASPRITRSAAIGLAGGLVLGAIYLGVRALTTTAPCDGLLAEDCSLERQMAADASRLYALFALGLILVAAGLLLFLRKNQGAP